jgi:hypothetical protein
MVFILSVCMLFIVKVLLEQATYLATWSSMFVCMRLFNFKRKRA